MIDLAEVIGEVIWYPYWIVMRMNKLFTKVVEFVKISDPKVKCMKKISW